MQSCTLLGKSCDKIDSCMWVMFWPTVPIVQFAVFFMSKFQALLLSSTLLKLVALAACMCPTNPG